MVRRLLVAPIIALAVTWAADGAARASCAAPPSVPDQVKTASLVFIGTVLYTYDGDRVAHVKVESIWKGPALRTYLDVHGSPVSGQFAASSVDRTYQSGTRYLFVLYSDAQPLQDNSCTATQPYTTQLAALAPADARSPIPPTVVEEVQNLAGQYLDWISAAVAAVVAAVLTTLWTRWRRTRRRA
jgi:hypothetical protein